jgi:hypothetical protein
MLNYSQKMPILVMTTKISGSNSDSAVNTYVVLLKHIPFVFIGNFSPPGELISLQRLRCSSCQAVDHYSFMGHCLNLNVRVGWVGLNS